jgi:hypothetical protein
LEPCSKLLDTSKANPPVFDAAFLQSGRFFAAESWGVIPETSFDIGGKIVAGILLVLAGAAVFLGPARAVAKVWTTSSPINVTLPILMAILASFVAIVTKSIFE